ncbi:hypothetical protein FNV43_RR18203 [Rhamnella rubrinervis]|uniref:Uncharacterized protein n=1 Tax=Rhamnella rubrinervis TaxID=2594499 RepID=A0A8K0DYZ9_9ROSA|nr:hypothetical protein FNV43_RR18203 [Rhamnella rubrinervis]
MPTPAILVVAHRPIGEVAPTNRHGHFLYFLHETQEEDTPLRRANRVVQDAPQVTKGKTATFCRGGSMQPAARPIGNPLPGKRRPPRKNFLNAGECNLEEEAHPTAFMRRANRPLASYPAADMGKLKMKISKAEEATKKKKRAQQREMTDEVGLEVEQNALKPNKPPEATKGGLEGSGPRPKVEKDRELSPRTHYAKSGERQLPRWLMAPSQKYIYKKAAIDAILKNTNDMIKAFKAGQTEDWATPDPSDEEEDGQEDLEITSGEDEPDEGDALPREPTRDALDNAEPNDSFEEAMRLPSNEESGPGQTSRAANANELKTRIYFSFLFVLFVRRRSNADFLRSTPSRPRWTISLPDGPAISPTDKIVIPNLEPNRPGSDLIFDLTP